MLTESEYRRYTEPHERQNQRQRQCATVLIPLSIDAAKRIYTADLKL